MQKKYFLIVLLLIAIITVAVFAPTLAHNYNEDDKHYPKATPIPGAEYVYAQAASVVLNLPQGGVCNKTNIRFQVMDVSAKSTKGAEDYLEVAVWTPSTNKFTSVVAIDDNQVAVDSLKAMLGGLTLYFQVIKVDDTTIDLWSEDDSLIINLTKPVNIMFGDPLPANSIYRTLNFTLPPMTIRFIQTGEVYEKLLNVPTTYASGWSRTVTEWRAPGWANVQIPAWTGTTWMPNAANYVEKLNIIAIKP
jgi:hypothetical protein